MELNKDKKSKRRVSPDMSTMMYGKVPPQAKELEEAVLGAIMLERNAFDSVVNIIRPESFYVDANQRIFRAMQALAIKNLPMDELMIVQQLKETEELDMVGGPYYLSKLTRNVVSAANIEQHSFIVQQQFIKRELIRLGGQLATMAYDDSISAKELMGEHEKEFTALTNEGAGDNAVNIDAAMVQAITRLEGLIAKNEDITGVPTGFFHLDKLTSGWQDTDLIILAARPSVGKTAFALNLARNAAMHPEKPVPVAFFSLEMSTGQLTNRLMSAESGIWLEKISRGKVDEHELKSIYKKAVEPMSKKKMIIDDTPALDLLTMKSKCRRLKRKHKIGLIIIDYLQLMSGDSNDSKNREREIAQISRGLKGLAKELQVPIIALSQLSRETEKRKGDAKMPMLSDLRESGAIEQDADVVAFMYRPEYYSQLGDENGESTKGLTYLSVAKHRNGTLAQGNEAIKLKAELHIQKFHDWNSMDEVKASLGGGSWRPLTQEEKSEDNPF